EPSLPAPSIKAKQRAAGGSDQHGGCCKLEGRRQLAHDKREGGQMIDIGRAELARDDIAYEDEVLPPERLVEAEGDSRIPDVLGGRRLGIDDVENGIADTVNANKADHRHDEEEKEGLREPSDDGADHGRALT